jgi:hypothetical protein
MHSPERSSLLPIVEHWIVLYGKAEPSTIYLARALRFSSRYAGLCAVASTNRYHAGHARLRSRYPFRASSKPKRLPRKAPGAFGSKKEWL